MEPSAAAVDHAERLIDAAHTILNIPWVDIGTGVVTGTARALASQSARAAGARERVESAEGWYDGGGTGNLRKE